MAREGRITRVAVVVASTLFALLVAEAGLQLLAWRVRTTARAGAGDAVPDGRVVLCVGDSFTYGSGADTPEGGYPAQLQTWLRENLPAAEAPGDGRGPGEWIVRNAGWPGRNSTEVVARLPEQLRSLRPRYVCMLVGLNNRWNHRAEDLTFEEIAAGGAAPDAATGWTWRLPRLLAIAWAGARQRFGGEVSLEAPAEGAPGGLPSGGDLAGRLADLRARAGEATDVEAMHRAVVDLRREIEAADDSLLTAGYVALLSDLNLYDDAIDAGEAAIARWGRTPALASALVRPLARNERHDEAMELARFAVAASPDDLDRRRDLAIAYRLAGRPDDALREFAAIAAVTGDVEELEKQMRKMWSKLRVRDSPAAAILAEELGDRPDLARAAAEALERVRSGGPPTAEASVLERDLGWARRLVEDAGARLVLVTYPFGFGDVTETVTAFGRAAGIPVADPQDEFRPLLLAGRRAEFFVPDGHCNDRGYAILADVVGRAIRLAETGSPDTTPAPPAP